MTIDTAIRCTICNRTPAALRFNDQNLCAPCAHAVIDQVAPVVAVRSPEEIEAARVRRIEAAIVQALSITPSMSRPELWARVALGPLATLKETIQRMIADGRLVERIEPAIHPRGYACVRGVLALTGASTSTHKGAGGETASVAGPMVHASA